VIRSKSARRYCAFACALGALVAAACSLPSSNEFVQGNGGQSDGGRDGTSPIADSGAPTSESGTPGVEGGSADAGLPFCPTGSLFCDDFEDGPATTKWDKSESEKGGTMSTVPGRGGGQALLSTVTDHADSVSEDAYFTKDLLTAPKTPLTVTYDVMVTKMAGVGDVDFDFFRFQSPFYRVGIRIADYDNGFFLHDYGDAVGTTASVDDDNQINRVLIPNVWSRVSFSLSYPGDNRIHSHLVIDGATLYDADLPAGVYINQSTLTFAGIVNTESHGSGMSLAIDHFFVTSP
jgi:hypothetical protein